MKVILGVSNRHVHLKEEDYKIKTIFIYRIIAIMTTITLINQMMEFISRNLCFRQILIFLFLYASSNDHYV